MSIDTKVTDVFGEPYPDEVEMGNKYRRAAANTPQGQQPQVMFEPLTVRKAICHALTQNYQDELPGGMNSLAPENKYKRGELANKFIQDQKPDLTPDEVSMIRELTAKLYAPLIVYQVWTALE